MDLLNQSNVEHWSPLWELFEFPKHTFLKPKLNSHGSKTVRTEWDAYFNWYFKGFHIFYQTPKIVSLPNTIFKLTEGKQNSWRQDGFWRPLSVPLPQIFLSRCMATMFVLRPPSTAIFLHCLHLLYNFCFFIPFLSPFPFFPLNLSPLPPTMDLLEPVL